VNSPGIFQSEMHGLRLASWKQSPHQRHIASVNTPSTRRRRFTYARMLHQAALGPDRIARFYREVSDSFTIFRPFLQFRILKVMNKATFLNNFLSERPTLKHFCPLDGLWNASGIVRFTSLVIPRPFMKNINLPPALVLFGIIAMGGAQSAQADLVVNGGFEDGTGGVAGPTIHGSFYGWTQSGDTSFTVVNSDAPNSGQYEAFLGPFGLGYLTQSLATTAGTSYELDFYLKNTGGNPNEFLVNWNGTSLFDQKLGDVCLYGVYLQCHRHRNLHRFAVRIRQCDRVLPG